MVVRRRVQGQVPTLSSSSLHSIGAVSSMWSTAGGVPCNIFSPVAGLSQPQREDDIPAVGTLHYVYGYRPTVMHSTPSKTGVEPSNHSAFLARTASCDAACHQNTASSCAAGACCVATLSAGAVTAHLLLQECWKD